VSKTGHIRIGNQTAFSAATVIEPFEYAVANGFDAFEWFPDKKESGAGWQESDFDAETRRHIKDTAFEHDIRLSVHAPWQVNPLQAQARERLLENLEFAKDIGASLLNVHLYTEEGMASYVESIVPSVKRFARLGIKLSIENTPFTGPEDFNELFRKLGSLGFSDGAQVGMSLDIGHANLCEATHNDYLRFVDLLDPQVPILHIHVHENYGDYDSHLPLFTGPAGKDASGIQGLMERLKRRNFSGCIILEQWPQPPTLLNETRNRLREIIGDSARQAERVKGGSEGILPQMDDFAGTIAEADRRCRSWREKLGWIHDLVTHDTIDLNLEQLTYLSIYLRFIGTGEVSVSEDGGHYRPGHHANMARRMYDRLSEKINSDNVFVIRKIYPWLPSYTRPCHLGSPARKNNCSGCQLFTWFRRRIQTVPRGTQGIFQRPLLGRTA
jgi:phosphoglucan,water dikinase